jgi:hypothetical protein
MRNQRHDDFEMRIFFDTAFAHLGARRRLTPKATPPIRTTRVGQLRLGARGRPLRASPLCGLPR